MKQKAKEHRQVRGMAEQIFPTAIYTPRHAGWVSKRLGLGEVELLKVPQGHYTFQMDCL